MLDSSKKYSARRAWGRLWSIFYNICPCKRKKPKKEDLAKYKWYVLGSWQWIFLFQKFSRANIVLELPISEISSSNIISEKLSIFLVILNFMLLFFNCSLFGFIKCYNQPSNNESKINYTFSFPRFCKIVLKLYSGQMP